MKAFDRSVLATSVLFGTPLLLQHSSCAEPIQSHIQRPVRLKPVPLIVPYALALSLTGNTSGWSPNTPYITLNLKNFTQRTLFFAWSPDSDPNFVVFDVEYKAPTSDPSLAAVWVQVKDTQPIQDSSNPKNRPPFQNIDDRQGARLLPGGDGSFSFPLNFPMSKLGFYRVKAAITVPEASEYNGAISPATKARSFKLVVRSKPFVIRHTADGFAPVAAVTSK